MKRGELWVANPALEEASKHAFPCVIVSDNLINRGASGLVIVVPLTDRQTKIATHVRLPPSVQTGLVKPAYAKCDHVRAIPSRWLVTLLGEASADTVHRIGLMLALVLGLEGLK